MALSKTILKKVAEKTKKDKKQQDFILTILDEENKGIGQFKKKYKAEIERAVKGEK
ncbi:MAG: hypothetical protein PUG71_07580 [bacterium]|nr:hypothetical protein [bacterium]